MGVTGTLKTLDRPILDTIENKYRIAKYTYMPTVFPRRDDDFKFAPENDTHLTETDDEYFSAIREEIQKQLNASIENKRAVLVFFEEREILIKFYNTLPDNEKEYTQTMYDSRDKELTSAEIKQLVTLATLSGKVTLATRRFGRGVDFVCHDRRVNNNGGVHVLQTFLSMEASEEVQIKGRTVRQGEPGSYSRVLHLGKLAKIGITKATYDDMKNSRNFAELSRNFAKLEVKRQLYFAKEYQDRIKLVDSLKEEHVASHTMLQGLEAQDKSVVDNFFKYRLEKLEITRLRELIRQHNIPLNP